MYRRRVAADIHQTKWASAEWERASERFVLLWARHIHRILFNKREKLSMNQYPITCYLPQYVFLILWSLSALYGNNKKWTQWKLCARFFLQLIVVCWTSNKRLLFVARYNYRFDRAFFFSYSYTYLHSFGNGTLCVCCFFPSSNKRNSHFMTLHQDAFALTL